MRKRTKKDSLYSVDSIEKSVILIGGAEKLARKIEVSYQTVINWRNGFSVPSVLNCIKIEKITEGKVKREEILPDYPWDELKSRESKEIEIVKSLLASGVDKAAISKATGLSVEEIEKLED